MPIIKERGRHMHIYKYLYVPEGLQKKKENLIKKLKNGKLLPGVYHTCIDRSEPAGYFPGMYPQAEKLSGGAAACRGSYKRF